MAIIELSEEERTQLREVVRHTHSTRELRHAQALLELARGTDVPTVAQRQAVGRSTVYDWLHRFIQRRAQPLSQRLQDRPRPGRPDQERQAVKELVHSLIKTDPRQLGYR